MCTPPEKHLYGAIINTAINVNLNIPNKYAINKIKIPFGSSPANTFSSSKTPYIRSYFLLNAQKTARTYGLRSFGLQVRPLSLLGVHPHQITHTHHSNTHRYYNVVHPRHTEPLARYIIHEVFPPFLKVSFFPYFVKFTTM